MNTAAYSFQEGHVGIQVSAQYGFVLPVDILYHMTVGVTFALPYLDNYHSVPCTTTNYGDHSFAVSGPVAWNSLPAALRLDVSLSVFRRRLKTFFMSSLPLVSVTA